MATNDILYRRYVRAVLRAHGCAVEALTWEEAIDALTVIQAESILLPTFLQWCHAAGVKLPEPEA